MITKTISKIMKTIDDPSREGSNPLRLLSRL